MPFLQISFLSIAIEIYWNIHEMFTPSLLGYSTRSEMLLDILLQKTNTGQERLSFGPKIWSGINPSHKNLKQPLLSYIL